MRNYCVSSYFNSQHSQRYVPTLLHVSCWKVHWLAHRCAIVASSSSQVCKAKHVYLMLLLIGIHCKWNTVWVSIFIKIVIIITLIIFTIIIVLTFQNCLQSITLQTTNLSNQFCTVTMNLKMSTNILWTSSMCLIIYLYFYIRFIYLK
jgi:hypothetical protein